MRTSGGGGAVARAHRLLCGRSRAAEALAAKDAQLMRFRGELDSLLDALRAAVADKNRAQAAVSEKLAADHLEFAAEAFDVGAE